MTLTNEEIVQKIADSKLLRYPKEIFEDNPYVDEFPNNSKEDLIKSCHKRMIEAERVHKEAIEAHVNYVCKLKRYGNRFLSRYITKKLESLDQLRSRAYRELMHAERQYRRLMQEEKPKEDL